ncbi:hypothetical protein HGRIS_009154 [Hohenbuehelia grisea]|uniref:Uncharacterized protein n=1 Tax=Hohenbuehelia grisea TaxID=104357 RepID=A0ABR3J0G3_9AGAR
MLDALVKQQPIIGIIAMGRILSFFLPGVLCKIYVCDALEKHKALKEEIQDEAWFRDPHCIYNNLCHDFMILSPHARLQNE